MPLPIPTISSIREAVGTLAWNIHTPGLNQIWNGHESSDYGLLFREIWKRKGEAMFSEGLSQRTKDWVMDNQFMIGALLMYYILSAQSWADERQAKQNSASKEPAAETGDDNEIHN